MPLPSLDFLLEASLRSLEDLELASRNHAANLSKALRRELEAWIEQEAAAMLARWMIDNREALFRAGALRIELKPQKVEFFSVREGEKTA